MANYTGALSTFINISGLPPEWNYTEYIIRDLLSPGTFINDDYSKAGSLILYTFVPFIKVLAGAKVDDYSDIFYNNFWSAPSDINLGLITGDVSYSLYIFNSHYATETLNSIENTVAQADLTQGILPSVFQPTEEKEYPLLIHLVGSPDFSGFIKFVYTSFSISINVVGSRLVQFAFDKIASMSIKHSKSVNTSQTTYLQQDRQQLDDLERRNIQCTIIRKDSYLNSILGYGQNLIMAIPVSMEKMTAIATVPLQGLSVIDVTTDITDFFELTSCKYIILYDGTNLEVIKLSSVDFVNNKLNLLNPVTFNFSTTTEIYPAVLCWLDNYSVSKKNVFFNSYSLSFKEAIFNG